MELNETSQIKLTKPAKPAIGSARLRQITTTTSALMLLAFTLILSIGSVKSSAECLDAVANINIQTVMYSSKVGSSSYKNGYVDKVDDSEITDSANKPEMYSINTFETTDDFELSVDTNNSKDVQSDNTEDTSEINVSAILCELKSVSMNSPEIIASDNTVETKVELPDIIDDLDIKLYNINEEGFNKKDGRLYLADIANLLDKYAPDGMLKSVACAMSYTEGGAGKTGVYAKSNNCFGIMATDAWEGLVYSRSTGDVYKDYATAKKYGADDIFRAYTSMEESVKDYVDLITGDYYKDVLNITDHYSYVSYIIDKGYGEERMIDTWLSVIHMYNLKKYD